MSQHSRLDSEQHTKKIVGFHFSLAFFSILPIYRLTQ